MRPLVRMTRPVAVAELEDHEIIARVVAGDHAGFEVLVRRYNQRLFRAARGITRSDADAEDVLQQAWLSVFRNLSQFRGDSTFATWATRIAVREAIAVTRKRPIVAEVVDAASDVAPDADLARARVGALLESCLAAIPQGNREVMVLRDVLELDTAETAACLGLSEEAVRVRLHRARAAIAAALTEQLADHAREIYRFDGERCDRITVRVMRNVSVPALL
ncbi:MAG: sigma-70 family RNA polymerase sigma factor [Deltaproteobacteria bacterium]|nr:MAG: sigma-70 family RNA polymerase sigma factor [Deltaproteobacteria bacterium]